MRDVKELENEIVALEKKASELENRKGEVLGNMALLNECSREIEENYTAIDIARSKYKQALFDLLDPIVREVLEKYKGVTFYEKHREMLYEDLKARCSIDNVKFRITGHKIGIGVCIDSVYLSSDFVVENDWIMTPAGTIVGYRPLAFEGTIQEMHEAYEEIETLCDELYEKLKAYNAKCCMLSGYHTTVSEYGWPNNSRHF